MNPEKELEKAMIQWLDVRGVYAVKVQSGKLRAMYGKKLRFIHLAPTGTPDIFCCIKGKAFYVEVKKDEVTAREWERVVDRYIETGATAKSNLPIIAQYEMHNKIIRAGGVVLLAGSIEEMERDLIKLRFIPSPHSYVHPDKTITGEKEKANRKRTPRRDTRPEETYKGFVPQGFTREEWQAVEKKYPDEARR